MKYLLLFIAFLIPIFSLIHFSNSSAKAQCAFCPALDLNWYPTVQWQSASCTLSIIKQDGDTCFVYVNYCYRTIGLIAPFTEIWICGFNNPDKCFPGLNYIAVDKSIYVALISQNPNNVFPPCPPCPWNEPNYRTLIANCRNNKKNMCESLSAFCVTLYTLCCNSNGDKVIIEGPSNFQGSCPDGCNPDDCLP